MNMHFNEKGFFLLQELPLTEKEVCLVLDGLHDSRNLTKFQ